MGADSFYWWLIFIYYKTQYLHNLQLLFEGSKLCTYQIWVTKPFFWTKLKGSCIWKQIVKTRNMGLEIWRIGLKLTLEDSINFFKTEIGGFVKRKKQTNIGISFPREPHAWILTLNFVLLGSLGTSLSLIFQIYKPYSSGRGTFFQIPKSSGPIQKQHPISFTCYTLLKIAYWIDMELYNKLKLQNT